MVFHQFRLDAVQKLSGLKPQKGVAIVRSIDGLGGPAIKKDEYDIARGSWASTFTRVSSSSTRRM